jgi:hypothetical protein
MRIYEVIAVMMDGSFGVYAARNEGEVKTLAMMIQEQGGIPMASEVEVPDGFNLFAFPPPKKALAEPSLN